MAEMYEIIDQLLIERGITGAQLSAELGMSRSFMTELRKGRAKSIKLETAQKIADYFDVSLDYLTGEETEKAPTETGERKYKDDEIMFALSRGGEVEITDAMFEEVKNFASFIGHREASKNSKQDRSDD